MADSMRTVRISVSFGRKLSLNFSTWEYNTSLAEEVEVENDEQLSSYRKRLRLRAKGAVYADIVNDYETIVETLPDGRIDYHEQAKRFLSEAQRSLESVTKELGDN